MLAQPRATHKAVDALVGSSDGDGVAVPPGEASHRTKGLLRLTMACNERCPFCNVPMEDYARPTPSAAETRDALQSFLDAGAETLTISGGEPTLLRSRLLETVRAARDGGIRFVELQTNAVLIDDAYAAALAQAGLTSAFVSLLSHVAAHHDTLAGLDGAFDRCLRGIDALLDHGVRVTLNPVTARLTQALVPDYVDFVAARLPRVRFLSLSAVQPHGRGRDQADALLPDYDVLARAIQAARARAAVHGIDLVNPYCGLPLCVGWSDDQDRCVEAFEAVRGGWRDTPGIENEGDKSHGAPCRSCALRTRCGGAWHAVWSVRGGAGIAAPISVVEPWCAGADTAQGQCVVRGPDPFGALDGVDAPTRWWHTDRLGPADVAAIVRSVVTDVALEVDTVDPAALAPALRAIAALAADGRGRNPQHRVRTWLGLRPHPAMRAEAVARTVGRAVAAGVHAVRILDPAPGWSRLVDALLAARPGLDVAVVHDPVPPVLSSVAP